MNKMTNSSAGFLTALKFDINERYLQISVAEVKKNCLNRASV